MTQNIIILGMLGLLLLSGCSSEQKIEKVYVFGDCYLIEGQRYEVIVGENVSVMFKPDILYNEEIVCEGKLK